MPPACSEPLPGPSLALSRVSPAARGRLWGWRPRRAFAVAFAVSVVLHLAFSFWPADLPQTPETQPLLATITELPPPPPLVATPPKPKPKRIARRAVPRPPPVIAPELAPADELPATAAVPRHGRCVSELIVLEAGFVDVLNKHHRRGARAAFRHDVDLPKDLE